MPIRISPRPGRDHTPSDRSVATPPGIVTQARWSMPTEGPLVDPFGRVHDDLRISVTDRCNLRCTYCMPEEGMTFLPRSELLSFDEIVRVARVAKSLGVQQIRLTGGEPLVRKGLPDLVTRLAAIGFEDIALTTNGMLLAEAAAALAAAGLRRVNVSCDSLRPERFGSIRRRGDLDTVLGAMDAAERAGLSPLKVNVVLLRGRNDDEILDLAAFARDTGRIVRFIEFMPLDAQGNWDRGQLVPGREVFERITAAWPLEPADHHVGPAPAERFRFTDGRGEIGLISSVTQPFCGTCNRLRLTADGAIRNCLFSNDETVVRDALRGGGADDDVALLLRAAVWGQAARPRHQRARIPPPRSFHVNDRRLAAELFSPFFRGGVHFDHRLQVAAWWTEVTRSFVPHSSPIWRGPSPGGRDSLHCSVGLLSGHDHRSVWFRRWQCSRDAGEAVRGRRLPNRGGTLHRRYRGPRGRGFDVHPFDHGACKVALGGCGGSASGSWSPCGADSSRPRRSPARATGPAGGGDPAWRGPSWRRTWCASRARWWQ